MENMERKNFNLPIALLDRAKVMQDTIGLTLVDIVRRAMDEHLTKWEQRNVDRPEK